MSEAWDWYLRQKEGAKNKWKDEIKKVNNITPTPQHILAIKLCSDELSEKDTGKKLFTEPHVNQLMLLAYNIGVANAKSSTLAMEKAIKEDLKGVIMEYLND